MICVNNDHDMPAIVSSYNVLVSKILVIAGFISGSVDDYKNSRLSEREKTIEYYYEC